MKYIGRLPDKEHYKPVVSNNPDRWIFEDKGTELLKIYSPVAQPWDREWIISTTRWENKSDKTRYAAKLILKLSPLTEDIKDLVKVVGFLQLLSSVMLTFVLVCCYSRCIDKRTDRGTEINANTWYNFRSYNM